MAPHFPPPPPLPAKTRLFQRMPPAVFSAILGLYGLGVAWRFGAGEFGVPRGAVEIYLGAVTLLFLFAFCAYVAKVTQRPGVFLEDLRVLPGRAGLATMTMGSMLFASVLVPYAPTLAMVVLMAGVAGHVAIMVVTVIQLLIADPGARQITPVLHLVFIGVIVSPAATIPMKLDVWVPALVWYATVASLIINALVLPRLLMRRDPAPLRPLHGLHLAPPSLIAGAAILVGHDTVGLVMLAWAVVVLALLLWRLPWILEAGFSGFWSAFTFPVSALAAAFFVTHISFDVESARIAGGLVLVAATLIIPPIVIKVMKLWATGALAAKTNAATA